MTSDKRVLTKNQKRRLKKKLEKQSGNVDAGNANGNANGNSLDATSGNTEAADKLPDVAVEYVSLDMKKELALPENDPAYEEFMRIFGKFSSAEELCGQTAEEDSKGVKKSGGENASGDTDEADEHDDDADGKDDDGEGDAKTVSRKQKKKMKRLSVAELKQLVAFPDVVEAHDVTSADPRLLVFLKSYRNTVPVPRHWCHKRKYLQGKRGIEKQPFMLPEFIAQTGISEVRGAIAEDDEKKKAKNRARERVQPKMGRVDIDYQVLHDAFFRYQTKPKLSILGDLYYEGKEFEVKLKAKIPGQLSEELKKALGMVDGVPPPWLLNMQRYGPPPAYPNLKIPGLNAPIPEAASFGYHPGGWGKPPVDENGQPLYGDVFGKTSEEEPSGEPINRERWGELEEVEEEEEEEEEDEGDEEDGDMSALHAAGLDATGMETPLVDGISSIASGLSTPGGIVDMRKGIRGTETPDVPQQLYTVLEQKETSVGSSLYGSGHEYVVPGAAGASSTDGTRTESGRVRRRFEDAAPASDPAAVAAAAGTASVTPTEDDDEATRKKKKAKSDKSKKHKDFKF
uniref:PSP proline-rich domain-containing protein n=1 Tax=Globisporangium ultimum (strain ATCC 200006 / CBS 805.95 / DAOM BR144) TaxID=431595 RepID=K3X053_GLOUD